MVIRCLLLRNSDLRSDWCHTLFVLLWLNVTQYDHLWVHLCCCKWHYFILFYDWVIFHCTYIPCLLYPFLFWWTLRLLPFLDIINGVAVNIVLLCFINFPQFGFHLVHYTFSSSKANAFPFVTSTPVSPDGGEKLSSHFPPPPTALSLLLH